MRGVMSATVDQRRKLGSQVVAPTQESRILADDCGIAQIPLGGVNSRTI